MWAIKELRSWLVGWLVIVSSYTCVGLVGIMN